MPKTTRADWAAQVPAEGIIGEIPASKLPSGVTDIGQLKAAGFVAGKVPQWNGSKFVPGTLPTPTPPTPPVSPVTPEVIFITWDVSTLSPLESDTISITIPGVTVNSQIFVGPPPGETFVFYQAYPTAADTAQLTVTNMNGSDVALFSGNYQIWVIN